MIELDKITQENGIDTAIQLDDYIIVKSNNQLIYFTTNNNTLKQSYVDEVNYNDNDIRAIVPYKQNDDNGIFLLTNDNVIYHPQPFVNVNDEISEKEISDVKLDIQPSKKAI